MGVINQVETAKTEKMKRQIMKAIVQRFASLDTDIDNGDESPAFNEAAIAYDADKGIIRIAKGDRRFMVRVSVAMR